jgi:glycosyltransferase involved in cell wall biosynthesis
MALVQSQDFGVGVRLIGHVPAADLPALYSAAAAFVLPSRYEGFGIPLLEAMGCGAPAIATKVSSLPEVLGDAGLLVDPDSSHELAEALARVLGDEDLAARLRGRGLARAAEFTWERAARATLQVYREAAG